MSDWVKFEKRHFTTKALRALRNTKNFVPWT
jgi:hypothetical protein